VQYFALLTVTSIVIAVLTLLLYRRTHDLGVLVGCGVLYYWSLFGAWYVVIDKTGGFSGKRYQYLEVKMFPVSLDHNYMLTLGLYAGFIILVQLTLLLSLSNRSERPLPRLVLRHDLILLSGFAAGLASYLLIRSKLNAAWTLDTSAYLYTRANPGEWFTLHQVLNRVALIPPAIGFATLLAGRRSRFFVNVRRRYTLPGYLLLFLGMGVFTFVLGNKNEGLVALLAGMLTYVGSVRRVSLLKVGAVVVAGFWFLYIIDFFRGVPVSEMQTVVEQKLEDTDGVAHFVTSSNEAYAAQFSLYGVLTDQVEPRFGYGLYSLACSIVPRVLWPNRPRDTYFYYADSVGAVENQGYSLHHATGWYLSFGMPGVALGAVVLGLLWAWCLNARQRLRPRSGLIARLFAATAPWLFVAYLPPLIRAGPEAYKGMIIEAFLIPLGTLALVCRPRRPRLAALPAEAAWLLPEPNVEWDHTI
jgi:hypothetical protein